MPAGEFILNPGKEIEIQQTSWEKMGPSEIAE